MVFWCSLTTCFTTKWYVSPMSNGMLTENVDCMNCMLLNVTFRTFFRSKHMRIWLYGPPWDFNRPKKRNITPDPMTVDRLSLKQSHWVITEDNGYASLSVSVYLIGLVPFQIILFTQWLTSSHMTICCCVLVLPSSCLFPIHGRIITWPSLAVEFHHPLCPASF